MSLPQILVLFILSVRIICDIIKHGQTITVEISAFKTILIIISWLYLLAWGGFFST